MTEGIMFDRIKSFFRITFGLAQMCIIALLYIAVFASLIVVSFLILDRGVTDYGLLAGILVSLPFIAVVWFGALGIGAWLATAK